MAKSVARIVKGVEKLIAQLDACVDSCSTKMALQRSVINQAEGERLMASDERDRATRILNKLTELIK